MMRLSRSARRPSPRPRKAPARLALDPLEGREVPATLVVTTAADTGSGSLRAQIAAAHSSGDTIVFDPALAGQTITLATGELAVNKSLTIRGLGASKLTVSGNDLSRVFNVGAGQRVTITDLTVSHGKAESGGGILNAGILTLRADVLTANLAATDADAANGLGGGAIRNKPGADLTLDRSRLLDNQTTGTGTVDLLGGGLLNEGVARVTDSTFKGNVATGGGAATRIGGSAGGAIDNYNGARLTVRGSTFVENRAVGAAGFYGMGGAIENNAGIDPTTLRPSTATITDSTFLNNLATGGDGSSANGGALVNQGGFDLASGADRANQPTMTLRDSTLIGNRAVGGPNGNAAAGTLGGGVGGGVMNGVGVMTVSNSLFAGNQAVGGDNSVSSPTPGNFFNLAGGGMGGGLINISGTLTVSGSTVTGNAARGGTTTSGPGGFAMGGGIDNWGKTYGPPGDGILRVSNSTISGNQAIAGAGGNGDNGVPSGFAVGGGIDNSFSGIATVTGSRLVGNVAIGSAGGTGVKGGTALGGGIGLGASTLFGMTNDAATLDLRGSTLAANLAQGGSGGTGANGGNGLGGGLGINAQSSATVRNSTIRGYNAAIGGAAGTGGVSGEGRGGGVRHAGTFTATSTVIADNFASTANDNVDPA